ncbi:MAG: sigma-70 family RNA polymerase sigma factor [Pseudobdellovibrionaceae bacterium]
MSALQQTATQHEDVTTRDIAGWLERIAHHKDRAAFRKLFDYYGPRLKSFLMRGGYAPELAEELMQESFLSVWEKAASFDATKSAPSTWLYTIARNKKIDYLRKNGRAALNEGEMAELAPPPLPHPNENLMRIQDSERVMHEINKLPDEQKIPMMKSFYEDKSHSEIAEELGIPLGTIKSRIRLAMLKLKDELGDIAPQEGAPHA